MVTVIPTVIRCLEWGMKWLKETIKQIFNCDNDKELEFIAQEMRKTVLWESASLIRKILSELPTWGAFI